MYHGGLAPKWQKGQTGNPGGRPKQPIKMTELARSHGPEAINLLVEKMRHGEDDRVQIMAAKILLDRGYGAVKHIDDEITGQPIKGDSEARCSRDKFCGLWGLPGF